ncbi:MAG: hypothetical protein M3145_04550 [Pseudomonadota bacterium]|nr:hypothetical protein [Pseudomonadota bacterium]
MHGQDDRLFHARIAAATRNTVLASIVNQLWEQSSAPIFGSLHPCMAGG